jgi:hypothetical protein
MWPTSACGIYTISTTRGHENAPKYLKLEADEDAFSGHSTWDGNFHVYALSGCTR